MRNRSQTVDDPQESFRPHARSRHVEGERATVLIGGNRLFKAIVCLGVAIVAVLGIDVLHRSHQTAVISNGGSVPRVSFQTVFDQTSSDDHSTVLPDDFEQDYFLLDGFTLTGVTSSGSTIGFECDEEPKVVMERCVQQLKERGWIAVESGQETLGSFVRSEGVHTWLMVSITPIAESTSVVLQRG